MSAALAAAVKERPILFSAPMVRAILEGRKTQTRRVANVRGADRVRFIEHGKLIPPRPGDAGFTGWVAEIDKLGGEHGLHLPLICPYGVPGDRLWVRETWAIRDCGSRVSISPKAWPQGWPTERIEYMADDNVDGSYTWNKRSPIHMPRWASRLTLEIVNLRVERVQDISEEDAFAEGTGIGAFDPCNPDSILSIQRGGYMTVWNKINERRGYGWDKNPWVWVIEFKRVTGDL